MSQESSNENAASADTELLHRRLFLRSVGKWSGAAIVAALAAGAWLSSAPTARAGGWVNRRGGVRGGGWINGGGGGGGWVNRRVGGGGGWVNRW